MLICFFYNDSAEEKKKRDFLLNVNNSMVVDYWIKSCTSVDLKNREADFYTENKKHTRCSSLTYWATTKLTG